jgi:hypothetical protein
LLSQDGGWHHHNHSQISKREIIYGAGSLYRQTSLQVETRIFRQNKHDLALKKTQDFSPKLSSPFLLHRQKSSKSSRVKIIAGNLSSTLSTLIKIITNHPFILHRRKLNSHAGDPGGSGQTQPWVTS